MLQVPIGRIGYLITPAALLYATGGWAYGHVKTSASMSIPGGSVSFSQDHDQWGWAVGTGLEYAFNPSWSFKAEYLYIDLGEDNVFNGTPIPSYQPCGNVTLRFVVLHS